MSATTAELRKGDLVEVRSAAEILATLDDRGERDALPFMPEMVAMCGRRFTVAARAERICDTITAAGVRAMETPSCSRVRAATDRATAAARPRASCTGRRTGCARSIASSRPESVRATDEAARDSLLALDARQREERRRRRRALPVSGDAGERRIVACVEEGSDGRTPARTRPATSRSVVSCE